MIKRNVSITLEKAQEWYNSGNDSLKEIALQAFNENELKFDFRKIKSLSDACSVLGLDYNVILSETCYMKRISRASAAMFNLNIIKKHLTQVRNYLLQRIQKILISAILLILLYVEILFIIVMNLKMVK